MWGALFLLPGALALRAPLRLEDKDAKKVLMFVAVGSDEQTMKRTIKNIDHVRATYPGQVDLYLAHYDSQKDAWRQHNAAWYEANVRFSAQRQGIKFRLMKDLLSKYSKIANYDWVWALDEDVDFSSTDLQKMIQDAEATGALIVAPALTFLPKKMNATDSDSLAEAKPPPKKAKKAGLRQVQVSMKVGCMPNDIKPMMCNIQVPHDDECLYRYVNFIEVTMPLMRPKALWEVLSCDDCFHRDTLGNDSIWGIDMVWCNMAARKLGHPKKQSCAILDHVPVINDNSKTLPKHHAGTIETPWGSMPGWIAKVNNNNYAREDTKFRHFEDFVDFKNFKTLKCVTAS